MFDWFSGWPRLMLRSSWVKLGCSGAHKVSCLRSVPYVITSMTLFNVTATPGIFTAGIGSRADVCTGYCRGWVDWISESWWGTEFSLYNGYHTCSSLIIPELSLSAICTNLVRLFCHTFVGSNPTVISSVSQLNNIAAAQQVKVLRRPMSSAHSIPGISKSYSHLLIINNIAHT